MIYIYTIIIMEAYKTKLSNFTKPNGKPLAKSTQSQYLQIITMIQTKIGMDWRFNNLQDYFNNNNFTPETQKNYINAIINYLKCFEFSKNVIATYINKRDDLEALIQSKPKLTEKKAKNLVDWNDIIKWFQLIKIDNDLLIERGETPNRMNELLLCLYITFPRRNELADLKYYIKPNSNENYYNNLKENAIIYDPVSKLWNILLCDYKTDEYFGHQHFPIDITEMPELYNLIDNYIESEAIIPGSPIFISPKNRKALSRLNLTKTLQRSSLKYLKKSISTNMIRHSFNNSKYKDIKKELIMDSYNQGHSIGVKLEYYVS